MAFSARDRRIIIAIEQGLRLQDPVWVRRIVRRLREFEQRESAAPQLSRRAVKSGALTIGWFGLLCVCAARGWPWLCAALAFAPAARRVLSRGDQAAR